MTDLARWRNGAKTLINWQVLTTGGVRRRAGLRFVAPAVGFCILRPFEPSTTDAYILEFSDGLLRFYTNTALLGAGSNVVTPYVFGALRQLRFAQANDVMFIAHGSYAPQRLARTTPTTFSLSAVAFYPPPTDEAGLTGTVALTLSATGGPITVTAASAVFLPADVQRQLVSGTGRAILTGYTSPTVMTAAVLEAFASTSVAVPTPGWRLRGSPVAQLTPDIAGPVGATVALTLGQRQAAAPELLNQDFTTWTNYSGTFLVLGGTHTGPANSINQLLDVAHNFITAGVLPTHVVNNITDASSGVVTSVSQFQVGITGLLFGGTDNDFDVGDSYGILETGASHITAASASLSGGTAGHGWIQRAAATVVGAVYEVRFTVGESPIALQIGTTVTTSNVYAEASFPPGDHAALFMATTTTSYVQFRNNQNTWGSVSKVSVKGYTIGGFRSTDVGRYIKVHGGLILLRTFTDASHMSGELIKELSTTDAAAAQAWTLEDPTWSDMRGWPRALVFYEQRLYFAGSASFPQTIWGSAVNSFLDFFVGTDPNDAVEFSVVESGGNITLNVINWLMPTENLLTGTSHGVTRLIGSGDDPITGTSPPRARSNTYGSDTIVVPIKVDQALLFPARQGSKLREVTLDQGVATRFVGRDLAFLSGHLLKTLRLIELAYAPEPISTVWGVRSDGSVIALTYDQPEQLTGWWHFATAGSVESIATIPHPTQNRDQVWMAVNRANGRGIEVLDEEAAMPYSGGTWMGLQVDAGVIYTGVATSTITGLGHLNGQTVAIVGGGVEYPSQVVSGGQVTGLTPPVTTAFVGLPYAALGETMPPELSGLGTIQRSPKHWVELTALLDATVGFTLQGQALPLPVGVPFTGEKHLPFLGWGRDGTVTFAQLQPLPATLLGLVGYLDVAAERDG